MTGRHGRPRSPMSAAPPTFEQDAWTRTHVNVVPESAGVGWRQSGRVHSVGDRWPGKVATGCGQTYALSTVVFTGRLVNCERPGCVRSRRKPTMAPPVDRPVEPLEGGARQHNNRRHATSNGVADRTDEDLFQSVKSATDNRVKVRHLPRSQVVTAATIRQRIAETTSPGQVHRRRPPRA